MLSGHDQKPFRQSIHLIAIFTVVVACWICCDRVEANGGEIYSGAPISLHLADADLVRVIGGLVEATDLYFAVDAQTVAGGGIDRLVTVEFESVPWDLALHEILAEAGLEWTIEGKVIWIHLPAYRPEGDRSFTGDPVKLRLEEADLRDVLDTLAKVTGVAIDLEPDIEGSVTLSLRNVPWDQLLDFILRISGLDYTQTDDALSVFRVSDGKGMQFLASVDP